MNSLEDAIMLAVRAHLGQIDKAGQPYVLHPLRVMLRVDSFEERIVAVLHDVVEDSSVSLADLRDLGYSLQTIEAVECLTRRQNETYEEFITRAGKNPIARVVKLADLKDNMDITRLAEITDKDIERLRKYLKAWTELNAITPNIGA